MPRVALILPAAGQSSRFGKQQQKKKPFVDLQGKPLWLRALEPFTQVAAVEQFLVVVSPDEVDWFKEKYRANLAFLNIEVIAGGNERADSVGNALQQLNPEIEFVAVHDAARPLIVKEWIEEVFEVAFKSGAAIPATRIASTIKRSQNGVIAETVSRENLWAAQTPQVFGRKLLEQAYAKRGDFQPTDEAQLVERLGQNVALVESSPMNIKITTQQDLRMAQGLLSALPKAKSLRSLHPFADDNPHLLDGL